jgi:hypothetical protein
VNNRLVIIPTYNEKENIEKIIREMAATGKEPIGSMGNDVPLAILSIKPYRLFNYFKQLFAQVTNPPIDPIREELVMTLSGYIGSLQQNLLDESPDHVKMVRFRNPVIKSDYSDPDLLRQGDDFVSCDYLRYYFGLLTFITGFDNR